MEDSKDDNFLLDHMIDESVTSASMPQSSTLPENNLKSFKQGSLVALTQKFFSLIHYGNGVVDLNIVSKKSLNFPP